MKERIQSAYDMAKDLCFEYSGGDMSIPDEDQVVLDKYMANGHIQLVNKKKGKLSKLIYYPSLESKEFKGLSGNIWLRILRHCMRDYGIESGLSVNSMKEYVYKYWVYNIEPTVIKNKAAGDNQMKEELEAFELIISEEVQDGE